MTQAHQDSVSDLDRSNRPGLLQAVNVLVRQKLGMGLSPAIAGLLSVQLGDEAELPTGWIRQAHKMTASGTISIKDLPPDYLMHPVTDLMGEAHDRMEQLLCNMVPLVRRAASVNDLTRFAGGLGPLSHLHWLVSEWLRTELLEHVHPAVVAGEFDKVLGSSCSVAHVPTRMSAYIFRPRVGYLYLPKQPEVSVQSDGALFSISVERDVVIHLDPSTVVRLSYDPGS